MELALRYARAADPNAHLFINDRRHTYRLPGPAPTLLIEQGERYKTLMGVFLVHPELSAVTWWGISDLHTSLNEGWDWWRNDQPLLFDRQLRPKPGYRAVLEVAGAGAAPGASN